MKKPLDLHVLHNSCLYKTAMYSTDENINLSLYAFQTNQELRVANMISILSLAVAILPLALAAPGAEVEKRTAGNVCKASRGNT